MKTVWKWILGIVIALVVLAILAGVVFLFRFHMPAGAALYGWHMRGPWMMMPFGRGRYMFGSGLGIIGGLFTLGLLALVVLGIVGLVQRRTMPKTPPAAPAPELTCKHCGKPVQAGWVACPHCGKKL